MTDYSEGKIYKLTNIITNEKYIGSTINSLKERKRQHLHVSKRQQTRKIYANIANYGKDNFKIELIENWPCDNKIQLNKREGYHQVLNNTVHNGLNVQYARPLEFVANLKIKAAAKINGKLWKQNNPEKVKQYKINGNFNEKDYREKNKEKIALKSKEWRENNKDILSTKAKEYKEKNKDKIKEKNKKNYEKNKESALARNKKWRDNHKDEVVKASKEYYANNKEQLAIKQKEYYEKNCKEKRKEKITCECGREVSRGNHTEHKKTKYHQDYLSTKIEDTV